MSESNGANWFRSHKGAPTDAKWRLVAKRTGKPVALVVAIVWAVLDHASEADDRGSISDFDGELLADFLGCESTEVEAIMEGLRHVNFVTASRVTHWERHQVKRADSSAERTRRWRENQSKSLNKTDPVRHNRHGDDGDRHERLGDARREEKEREMSDDKSSLSPSPKKVLPKPEPPTQQQTTATPPAVRAAAPPSPVAALAGPFVPTKKNGAAKAAAPATSETPLRSPKPETKDEMRARLAKWRNEILERENQRDTLATSAPQPAATTAFLKDWNEAGASLEGYRKLLADRQAVKANPKSPNGRKNSSHDPPETKPTNPSPQEISDFLKTKP